MLSCRRAVQFYQVLFDIVVTNVPVFRLQIFQNKEASLHTSGFLTWVRSNPKDSVSQFQVLGGLVHPTRMVCDITPGAEWPVGPFGGTPNEPAA